MNTDFFSVFAICSPKWKMLKKKAVIICSLENIIKFHFTQHNKCSLVIHSKKHDMKPKYHKHLFILKI